VNKWLFDEQYVLITQNNSFYLFSRMENVSPMLTSKKLGMWKRTEKSQTGRT
jgi:hypothetical protein